jgi:hypothetical protein
VRLNVAIGKIRNSDPSLCYPDTQNDSTVDARSYSISNRQKRPANLQESDIRLTWNCVVVTLLQSLAATVAVRMIWMLLFLDLWRPAMSLSVNQISYSNPIRKTIDDIQN